MSLSAAELARVVEDLAERTVPAFVRQVRKLREPGFLLELRTSGEDHLLLVSLEPEATRLHRVVERPPCEQAPEGFVRTLREVLEGTRLSAMDRPGGDRAVRLDFGAWALVLELTGRHGNAFLLDAGGIVRSSWRTSASTRRDLRWGGPYVPLVPRPEGRWAAVPPRFGAGPGIHEEIAAAYAHRARQAEASAERRVVLEALRSEVIRLGRLAENLRRDLEQAQEAEVWRRRADLLKPAASSIPRGTRSVTVTDWFAPEPAPVDLALDPALDGKENLRRLYARARKLGRRPEALAPRIREVEERHRVLGAELVRLEAAPWGDPEAAAILERRRLRAPGAGLPPPAPRARDGPRLPYRVYRSSEGIPILVGRSARDNDALTFRVARGHHLWLHAAGGAGSHVVVYTPRGVEAPETTQREAAVLALHYSRLGRTGEGEVHLVRRCDVRRVRGAPAGMVTFSRERRLWVRIDPDLLRRLQASVPGGLGEGDPEG